ncbi:MAG: Coenzyme F420 hydrogenase/dehydrogenase, beta subunit C-terminal domain [Lachnospiraceae bacterium]|nr:Coenzyme F420 hydrogenase/dehydrogenase, beta subunit C-terminal domain [Lachnospiraceae bacterium]
MGTGVKTVCTLNQCVGCMACVDMCPKSAISIADTRQAYNAIINDDLCVNCGICTNVCQNNRKITLNHPQSWYQGWIDDESLRKKSSSGGAARAISQQFISEGGVVVSCCFRNGVFGFETVENTEDLGKFTGSKYVKSNPSGVYKKVQKLLKEGKQVLFIGLPCQVGALKTVIGENESLYTVDLICHGTPSPILLKDYLASQKIDLSEVRSISFRYKDVFGLEQNRIPLSQPGSCDNYLLAFLCGLDYTDNCYECKYAGINRGSDITIGDSWKSDLSAEEQHRGISIMLCQTKKGEQLLKNSGMILFPVDLEHAISVNDQLREPSKKTKKHDIFFEKYSKKGFNYATFYSLPFKCLKQRIKAILLKTKILRGGNYTISIK